MSVLEDIRQVRGFLAKIKRYSRLLASENVMGMKLSEGQLTELGQRRVGAIAKIKMLVAKW